MIRAAEPPTLREIALNVGVTPTTVSLALRDNPRISAPTRRKVKQAAEDLGYRPNAELSRMMSKLKSRQNEEVRPVIALVIGFERASEKTSKLRKLFHGIAEMTGYAMDVIYPAEKGMSLDRMADILRARGIRGGILYRLEGESPQHSDWMKDLSFCCVGTAPTGSNLPACEWAETEHRSQSDAPLLQTAMDILDLTLQRNRFGGLGFGMTIQLHTR